MNPIEPNVPVASVLTREQIAEAIDGARFYESPADQPIDLERATDAVLALLQAGSSTSRRIVDVSDLQALATDGPRLVLYFADQWQRDAFWDALDVREQ
ncbi:hypothetical protein DEJ17_06500 [Curtobacterium sp. MCSS17_011]|uniref:hypothetical protein n=1 Tax=Curtobacterium sp. MCSS17_011 TaxID=2175643 RepID=UPI000D89F543|nr:hypothetical protein [Curtobacterium sp. MCSS17_011]PYY60016.1 hypothetical protein DEJ17_06500 [Curtobacterium sp. MCSS17_011]